MAHKDFDVIKSAVRQEDHSFTFKGVTYTFPYDLPYFAMLEMIELSEESINNLGVEEIKIFDRVFATILGDDQYNQLKAARPDETQIAAIVEYVFRVYTPKDTSTEKKVTAAAKRVRK